MAPHSEDAPGLVAMSKKFGLKIKQPDSALTNGEKTVEEADKNNCDKTAGDSAFSDSNETKDEPNGVGSEAKQDAAAEPEAEPKPEPVKILEADVGATSESKDIYGKKGPDGEYDWVDKYPEDIPEAAENDETAKFAVIVRKEKSKDSRKKLEAHSLIVQSSWLRSALAEILKDYPGVACEIKRLIFQAPFKPFVHRWSDFLTYMARTDLDEKTSEHLKLLHSILLEEIGAEIKEFEDYVVNGVITFGALWMIFQPGSVITAAHKGPLSGFEVVDSEYIETQCGHFLQIEADCVDWNGQYFGRATEKILLPAFKGTRKISSLKAVPLALCENRDKIKLSLIDRGKEFESLGGYCYKAYNGTAITWDNQNNEQTIFVTGRIIIDTDAFGRYTNYPYRYVDPFNEKDVAMLSKHNDSLNSGIEDVENEVDDDSKYLADDSEKKKWKLKLSPYHLMLCRSRIRGYSLKLKKWLEFFVPVVEDIKWNSSAFDSLVLPEDQKELVLSFAESQVLNRQAFDDVISGKGKGIIMLLAGPPGVGKTLTAEAVAEHMRCPLHSITSGDLGSHPREVEWGLTRTIDLVSRWNAILLIDECDVFLESRSVHDLERNKTVSVFLRTLEYYEGIMFMTTNRSDNIDTAFQSRIHVSMEYPDLNNDSRRQIWRNFIKGMSAGAELTETDLEELSTVQLNGRQIKNVLKTAQLLAMRKKTKLNRKVIETVLAIEKRRPILQS